MVARTNVSIVDFSLFKLNFQNEGRRPSDCIFQFSILIPQINEKKKYSSQKIAEVYTKWLTNKICIKKLNLRILHE